MKQIKVKTAEGRVAYDGPFGKKIPSDKFVSVRETHYIRRLIDYHKDLIEEGATGQSAAKPATPAPTVTATSAPAVGTPAHKPPPTPPATKV